MDEKVGLTPRTILIAITNSFDFQITHIEEEHVNDFLIELSGLLKELQCPYEVLIHSQTSNKMLTVESRYLLLEYLIAELMSVKMSLALKPKDDKNVITLVRPMGYELAPN
jgi:hypothetical protein